DNRVERSLYQRATGYTFDAVKIFLPKDSTVPVYAPYREHCPPDVTACIFWLKNRQSEEWRDAGKGDVSRMSDEEVRLEALREAKELVKLGVLLADDERSDTARED